jgi:hypothetical protein
MTVSGFSTKIYIEHALDKDAKNRVDDNEKTSSTSARDPGANGRYGVPYEDVCSISFVARKGMFSRT